MIEKLTIEQEQKISFYRDKWLKIGLSTEPCNRKLAEKYIREAYEAAGLVPPQITIWMNSPLEGSFAAAYLKALGKDQVADQVWDQVRAQVWDQVWDQVMAQVADQVWAQVRDQIYKSGYGSYDANWLGFYDFFLNETQLIDCKKLKPLMSLAENCGWWWPFNGLVILSEKPTKISMSNGRLHCDGDAAIRYKDGFSVYSLNGTRVSKEIACTSANELSASLIITEKNAQVRAEIVKKIGIARVLQDLGAGVIDTWKDYDLIELNLKDGRFRPFLKMKNPSVDLVHIEGVPPDIKTVKKALAWRNGLSVFKEPEILT